MKPLSHYPVPSSPDLTRILKIPRRYPTDLTNCTELTQRINGLYRHNRPCNPYLHYQHLDTLRPVQCWALDEIAKRGGCIGIIGVGWGKCLGPYTEIYDVLSGRRRLVSESIPHLTVTSKQEQGLTVKDATCFRSGFKPCLDVELIDGTKITASTDHPILTHRGYVQAKDLLLTDYVCVATKYPEANTNPDITNNEVMLMALLMSDGGLNQPSAMFTNADERVITLFKWLAESVCGGWSQRKAYRGKDFDFYLKQSRAFRERWGLFGLAKEKRLHPSMWGLTDEQVRLFINAFWACDGHVSKSTLELTLASEALLDDIRFLLLRLGVRSRKRFKLATCGSKKFPAWRLTLAGQSALDFLTEVGDVLSKEKACQNLRDKLLSTNRNTNWDVVPIGRHELSEICDELGYPRRGQPRKGVEGRRDEARSFLAATDGQFVSRLKFARFCKEFGYGGKYTKLLIDGCAWERVKIVTPAGDLPVYDLSVSETHNFAANHMIVHNSLIDLLAPLATPNCKEAVLLVPPNLVRQLIAEYLRLREHFNVPSFYVSKSETYLVKDAPNLHLVPYSKLSRHEATALLEQLNPDLIIADECHRLKNKSAAGTGRVMRYLASHPDTRLCAWSGTLTARSIKDYGHLSAFALQENSPLPIDPNVLESWATAIDPSDWPAPPGALTKLCQPGESLHSGFHRRLTHTQGVVSTTTSSADASIYILERHVKTIPEKINQELKRLRAGWVRPDGEELVEAMQVAKSAREIACGFFYRWKFPRGEPAALIDRWFKARKEWHQELREKLKHRREHLDSPLLCAKAAIRAYQETPYDGPLPVWRSSCWLPWVEIRDQVQHESEAVWLDDYLAKDAAQWAKEHRGIVWYEHTAFGQRVAELAEVPLHAGGTNAEQLILAERGDRSIVASIKAHGTGRDGLQKLFASQLVANPPASGQTWEQLLGRLSRIGQAADEIHTYCYRHTIELKDALSDAITQAGYIQNTLGSKQKLLCSSFDWEV